MEILSKDNLKIKDVIEIASNEININIDLTGKGNFTVARKPIATEGDFVIQKGNVNYQGVVSGVETIKEQTVFKIYTKEIDCIFDTDIILDNESLIATVGIEDFIQYTIMDNYVNSSDAFLNIGYIKVIVSTHTIIDAPIATTDSIYNFMSYLAIAKELYGIILEYEFLNNNLIITVSKKDIKTLTIDATVEDIITFQEFYKTDAIAKVTVLITNTGLKKSYYLLSDLSITDDINNPNRARGTTKTVTCVATSQTKQKAVDTFKSNSFQHNIVLTLSKDSKIYEEKDFIVGRSLRVKTNDNGIYNTFIRAIDKKSNSNKYTVTCGNMKVTLVDKIKEMKGAINK